MKLTTLFYLSLSLLFLSSCKNSNTKELSYILTQDTLLSKDTILSNSMDPYSVKQINDSIYFCIKKSSSNALILYTYHEDSINLVNIIKLNDDYNNKSFYGRVSSLDIIDNERILLFQKNRITIYNLIESKIDFTYYHSQDDSDILLKDYAQPIIWNQYDSCILSYILRYDDIFQKKHDFDTEFSAEIDIKNSKLRILPLKYHDVYKTNLCFSSFSVPYIISTQDYYIGSFGITPDLLVLNKKTNSIKHIKIKHLNMVDVEKFDTTKVRQMDYYDKHLDVSINYFQIIYDPFKNVYYRFYMLPLPKGRNDEGLLYTFNDKASCITVISNNFTLIGDVILPKEIFHKGWYPTSHGLIQIFFSQKSNNYIIKKINIETK